MSLTITLCYVVAVVFMDAVSGQPVGSDRCTNQWLLEAIIQLQTKVSVLDSKVVALESQQCQVKANATTSKAPKQGR